MNGVPHVSVIVPFLNTQRFLEEAIESVLAQTYRDWDLWLVDDGSSDGSTAIARRFARQHRGRIHYVEHEGHRNRGAAASRNHGIRSSRGEYVALLDADDAWLPHKLEEQVALLGARPGVGMVYGRSTYWHSWAPAPEDRKADFDVDPGVRADAVHDPPALLLECYPLGSAPTPCPSDILLRRSALEPNGGFEERFQGVYQLYEDQAFLAKIFLTQKVYVSSKCWDRYRVHPDSCVSTVNRDNQYHAVRRFYFEWLARHLEQSGVEDAALWSALRRARKPYEKSILERLTSGLRRRPGGQ